MPAEAANTLAPHRVPLVGHGRAANLILFERLFELLHVGQKTDVRRQFVRRDAQSRKRGEHFEIDVAGVCLARDLVSAGEAGEGGDELVEFLALTAIKRSG